MATTEAQSLRARILELTAAYHAAAFPPQEFIPGRTPVPVSGRVFDAAEIRHLVDASLDFWLTAGPFAAQFEREFAQAFGISRVVGQVADLPAQVSDLPHAILVNSGSSANLLALASLTSPTLAGQRLRPDDEVITVAAGFPTTVNPILQNRLVPVFVDVTLPTYNVDVTQLEAALSERTRAVVLAHTLGNPFDLEAVMAFARKHDLWVIEDCCDALGADYRGRRVGTFGDLATFSFYPAHHITMGEGGAVLTNDPGLAKLVESFRDWGRDCWCDPGKDNTCGKRFAWQLGELPFGYDHKYAFSHVGYNLKATDMQAAVGLAQLGKLQGFIEARRRNFAVLRAGLEDLDEFLILPQATCGADPSWFGFPLAVRPAAPFPREELLKHLNARKIGTRLLFGGNLTRQPAYQGVNYRKVGDLANSDFVMSRAFWIGVYPGLTRPMLDYVIAAIHDFCRGGRK